MPGLAASPGLAIGPVRLLRQRKIVVERTAKDPERERERLHEAIATARAELQELYQEVKEKSGAGRRRHLPGPRRVPRRPRSAGAGRRADRRRGRAPAGRGRRRSRTEADSLAKLDDPLLAGRATDLRDVGRRVLRRLAGVIEEEPELPAEPVILLAEDLTPSDAAALDPARVLGFCTAGGGPTSHAAIIARSLGIPAVVGAGPGGDCTSPTGRIGGPGRRQRRPLCRAERGGPRARRAPRRARWPTCATRSTGRATSRLSPPTATASRWWPTPGLAQEAAQAVEAGGEGIGLMRSEFLFLERDSPPSEDEQYEAYRDGRGGPRAACR